MSLAPGARNRPFPFEMPVPRTGGKKQLGRSKFQTLDKITYDAGELYLRHITHSEEDQWVSNNDWRVVMRTSWRQ